MTIIRKYKKPKKMRDGEHPQHRRWVKKHVCCVCGGFPTEAAHARKDLHAGTSQKTPDCWLLPLCHDCHMEQHGGEVTFEQKHGIDMKKTAIRFMNISPYRKELEQMMREDDLRWIANNAA